MIFEKDYMPQFREADENGLVGLRGYISYFQDVATHYMHNLDKGNDVIPEKYGICWMYTKYKLHIEKEADFTEPLHFETWIEQKHSSVLMNQGIVISKNGESYAEGRLESCLYNMNTNRLTKPESINFPDNVGEEKTAGVEPFVKIAKTVEDMEYVYTHTVRYTDLDKSRHMTNLQYVSLLLNAFDSAFYDRNRITDFEIHYLSQCFEGEEIKIYKKEENEGYRLAGIHADGKSAVQGFIQIERRIPSGSL